MSQAADELREWKKKSMKAVKDFKRKVKEEVIVIKAGRTIANPVAYTLTG